MTRIGHGQAYGAVTIVNATATGIGCSLAVQASTQADWTWGGKGLRFGGPDGGLARAVWARARQAFASGEQGAAVAVRCPFPPSRGLKTSSSVAAALLRAAADAAGQAIPDDDTVRCAVEASRDAGVTLTGALDDQTAAVRGGCHVTDNRTGKVLHSIPTPRAHVAIWVPEAAIAKSLVRDVDVSGVRDAANAALRLVRDGRMAEAMTLNGQAYLAAYQAAGLPVDVRPADVALANGARGAGLSGTGPAVAALFGAQVDLPAVPGGTWTWTQVAP